MFPLVLLLGLLRRRCRCKLSLALLGVLPGVITMGRGRVGGGEDVTSMRGREGAAVQGWMEVGDVDVPLLPAMLRWAAGHHSPKT